jgi:hypothetical protein
MKPEVDIPKLINNMKSVTARNVLTKLPQLRQQVSGLWNQSYLLVTREDLSSARVQEFLNLSISPNPPSSYSLLLLTLEVHSEIEIKRYLNSQWALRSFDKFKDLD